MSSKWQRLLTDGLVVAGLGLMLSGFTGVMTTKADQIQTSNPGEISIHVESDCSGSDTDPKVGEEFWVHGKNFNSGTQRWLFVTDGTNAHDPVVIGPVSVGTGSSFCVGPFTLADGHYKAYVDHHSTAPTNDSKTKVFKVSGVVVTDPPVTDPPATDPPATDPPATDPPATDPPATDPPATDPPVTQPPATDPPATDPPATDPPATDPPATDPPVTQPPATDAPPSTDVGTTTTSVASEGPTSNPTTSVESESLPATGGGSAASITLTAGLMLGLLGITLRVMARRTA